MIKKDSFSLSLVLTDQIPVRFFWIYGGKSVSFVCSSSY